MKNRPRYRLIRDDDAHWYIIPADKTSEAQEYLDAVYDYWENEDGWDGPEPEQPEWMRDLGTGPESVTFTAYTID